MSNQDEINKRAIERIIKYLESIMYSYSDSMSEYGYQKAHEALNNIRRELNGETTDGLSGEPFNDKSFLP